jgi:hypothetical protein
MLERDEAVSGLSVSNSPFQGEADRKDGPRKQNTTQSREPL